MAELSTARLARKPEIFTLWLFTDIACSPLSVLNIFPFLLVIAILSFPGKRPGQCPCKEGYTGEKCDRCQFGYRGHPACVRCDCGPAGSVNEDPCAEPCLCKVRVGVEAGAAFPPRFPGKGEHPVSSDDQPLSEAARFKHSSHFLHTVLRSMASCSCEGPQYMFLDLDGHLVFLWVPSGQWPCIPDMFVLLPG